MHIIIILDVYVLSADVISVLFFLMYKNTKIEKNITSASKAPPIAPSIIAN